MADNQHSCEIAPGIFLIKVPLPENPLKQLNSYLILDEDRPALVDVGFNRIECEQVLRRALDGFGLDFQDIDVLATHSHPDHVGNLDRIWRPSMRVYAHMHSFEEPRIMNKLQSSTFLPIVDAVTLCAESQRQPSRVFSTDLSAVKGDYPVTYLKDGDIFRRGSYRFQVIETPGHHMTHICLYDEASKIMLTGDHVLERITPNISSFMLETDELGDFLASLRKVRDYDVKLAPTTRHALPKWKTLCAPAITTSSTSQAARAGNTPIGKAGQWSRSSSPSAKRSPISCMPCIAGRFA